MVGNRHPLEVRRQRGIRPGDAPDIAGMVDRGVEVGVVADARRQAVAGSGLRHQAGAQLGLLLGTGGVQQQCEQRMAQAAPGIRAQEHEGVQRVLRRHLAMGARHALQQGSPGGQRRQIDDLVANGHAAAQRVLVGPVAELGKRQVLDRELGVAVGRGQPAAGRRVVGVVERVHHGQACPYLDAISASSKIATARVQPAEAPRILCGKHEM
jgi:hypothetical protein